MPPGGKASSPGRFLLTYEKEQEMNIINVFGLVMMVVIMIPNIIFAAKCKEGFENR